MVEAGDIVILKSGGPEMVVDYVFQGDGTREKAAALKGFQEGDMGCSWQQILPNGSTKVMRESFKAATLKFPDGSPVAE